MNNLLKYLFSFSTTALLVSVLTLSGYGQRDIGTGEIGSKHDMIPVVVRSQDSSALNILRVAFSAHGNYRVVNSMQEAHFAIQVDPIGTAHSSLRISSGVPEKILDTRNVRGTSSRDSILRAVDAAIGRTSGLPGFFSGKIAYVGESNGRMEIYARDFLFGEGKRYTNDGVEALRPRWSPDGNYIVYTSYRSGFPNIHRIDLRQGSWKALANFKGTNTSARYSPDGSRLAMILTGRSGTADVYVGSSDAKGLKLIVNSNGLEASPCWSPDGREIVFVSDRNGPKALYRGSATGGQFSLIPTQISGYCAEPDWNHVDPDKLAFTIRQGVGFQIALYSFSQRKSVTLTNERGDALQPCWLNDGRHLLYTWRSGKSERIVLLDTKTGKRFPLSPESLGKASQASFLPPRG